VLHDAGIEDFESYRHDPACELLADIFVDPNAPTPPGVKVVASA